MASRTKEGNPLSGEETREWVSLDCLRWQLDDVREALTKAIDELEWKASKGFISEVKPEVADLLLKEVTRRVFGFSLAELDSSKLREIEFIRKELGLSGEFNPS